MCELFVPFTSFKIWKQNFYYRLRGMTSKAKKADLLQSKSPAEFFAGEF